MVHFLHKLLTTVCVCIARKRKKNLRILYKFLSDTQIIVVFFFNTKRFLRGLLSIKRNPECCSADTEWDSAVGIHVTYTAGQEEAIPIISKAEAPVF